MPVELAEDKAPAVEWTPEMEALAKEPAMPGPGLTPAPEAKAEAAPEPKVESPETPEPEQHVESASDVDAGGESESAADQPDEQAGLEPDEIELAKAYGFTDEEIGEFTSADLARAIAPFERGRIMRDEPAVVETKEPTAKQEPEKKPEPKVEPKAEDDLGEIDEEAYDPLVVKLAKSRKADLAKIAELEAKLSLVDQLVERDRQAVEQERLRHFDALVTAMGDEKFGPEDWNARTPAQWQAREALRKATAMYLGNAQREGKNVPLNSATVKRALVYAFPEDIRKQETAKVQKALVSQSKKRLGSPKNAPKRVAIPQGDPEKSPEVMTGLQQLWNEMQAENGSLAAR